MVTVINEGEAVNVPIVAYGVFCIPAESQKVGLKLSRNKQLLLSYVAPFAMNFITNDISNPTFLAHRKKLIQYIGMIQLSYWQELVKHGLATKNETFPVTKSLTSFQDFEEAHRKLCSIDGFKSPFDFVQIKNILDESKDLMLDNEWVEDFDWLLDMARRLWKSFFVMSQRNTNILITSPEQIVTEMVEFFDHISRAFCYFIQDNHICSRKNIHSAKAHLERIILDLHKAIVFSCFKFLMKENSISPTILKQWLEIRQIHIYWDNNQKDRFEQCFDFTEKALLVFGFDKNDDAVTPYAGYWKRFGHK